MNPDNLTELPEWNDNFHHDKEGEAWKANPTRDFCRAMYDQWNTVMIVLKAAFDSLKVPQNKDEIERNMLEDHVEMVMADAYEVAAKINSS
jgi:hypothetical protein